MASDTPTLIEITVETRTAGDRPLLIDALAAMAPGHPGFAYRIDFETGRFVLGGRDEEQLEAIITQLCDGDGIALRRGAPEVSYRETITRRVETDYTHKARSGAGGQFAKIKLVLEPGTEASFRSKAVGDAVPDVFLSGVAAGVATAFGAGIVAGFPVIDVVATLIDGAYHDVDSSPATFEIAATAACRQALREGGPLLLEPIMRVEIRVPADRAEAVCADLVRRRGRILDLRQQEIPTVVVGRVPLANLLGYSAALRSIAGADAQHTNVFDRYEPIRPPEPPDVPRAAALRIV